MNRIITVICFIAVFQSSSARLSSVAARKILLPRTAQPETNNSGCSCGVFLSGQLAKGSHKQPVGYPPIAADFDDPLPCTLKGNKDCTKKCIENLVKYLGKSSNVICASIDRDSFRERAYLFVKNCNSEWQKTNLSAGKEYCCKNGESYKCPDVPA